MKRYLIILTLLWGCQQTERRQPVKGVHTHIYSAQVLIHWVKHPMIQVEKGDTICLLINWKDTAYIYYEGRGVFVIPNKTFTTVDSTIYKRGKTIYK